MNSSGFPLPVRRQGSGPMTPRSISIRSAPGTGESPQRGGEPPAPALLVLRPHARLELRARRGGGARCAAFARGAARVRRGGRDGRRGARAGRGGRDGAHGGRPPRRRARADDLVVRELRPDEARLHWEVGAPAFDAPIEFFAALVTPRVLALPEARATSARSRASPGHGHVDHVGDGVQLVHSPRARPPAPRVRCRVTARRSPTGSPRRIVGVPAGRRRGPRDVRGTRLQHAGALAQLGHPVVIGDIASARADRRSSPTTSKPERQRTASTLSRAAHSTSDSAVRSCHPDVDRGGSRRTVDCPARGHPLRPFAGDQAVHRARPPATASHAKSTRPGIGRWLAGRVNVGCRAPMLRTRRRSAHIASRAMAHSQTPSAGARDRRRPE